MKMEAMLRLYEVILDLDPAHINMRQWLSHTGKGHGPHKTRKGFYDYKGCGTSACLLGAAACDPVFSALTDIVLQEKRGGVGTIRPVIKSSLKAFLPVRNMEAAMQGLNISKRAANYLFGALQSGNKEKLKERWWKVVRDTIPSPNHYSEYENLQ